MGEFNIKKAIELHRKRLGWREIAKILDVHPYSVQYRLTKLGLKSNKGVGSKKKIDYEKVYRLRDKGYTQAAIAQEIGFSESAVQKILRQREEKE